LRGNFLENVEQDKEEIKKAWCKQGHNEQRKHNMPLRVPLGKHVPAATDTHATREKLLETVFYTQFMPRCSKQATRLDLGQLGQ
jgi:hypothetical protein